MKRKSKIERAIAAILESGRTRAQKVKALCALAYACALNYFLRTRQTRVGRRAEQGCEVRRPNL